MAVNMKKVNERYDDYENRKSGFSSNFTIEGSKKGKKRRFILLLPPHENMDEMPFVEIMQHSRELPRDVKGASFSTRCQRDGYDDKDFGKCWPCGRMLNFRKKRKEKGDENDNKAGQFAPKRKPIAQVIDITPCFNKRGELKRDLKKCFGKHGKMDDCDDCRFNDVCEKFVMKWYMPIKAWEQFNDHFMDEGDITDMDHAIPIRVTRSGVGQYDTKYETKAFAKSAMKIAKGIQKRLLKKLIDLTAEDPKPTGTKDEIKQFYKDFFNLADIAVGDDDDDDDDDDDGGGKKEKKSKKNKDKKKSKKKKDKEKKNESKGSDKKKKKKKDKDDKLRKDMRRKARKGKLDR
ncbi:MAG: hypothetical protein ACTSW7_01320 [Candidatus Thorarchaeota archaeon]|nr:hypothetical protein [Thermoplasmatales archaeon]